MAIWRRGQRGGKLRKRCTTAGQSTQQICDQIEAKSSTTSVRRRQGSNCEVQAVRIALLLLSVAVFLGCNREAPRLVAARTPVMVSMVTEHCRDCHKRSISNEVPQALAIFDLDKPNWLAGIPTKSFCAFLSRLLPYVDPTIDSQLEATIDAELARRHRVSGPPASDQLDTIRHLCPSFWRSYPPAEDLAELKGHKLKAAG